MTDVPLREYVDDKIKAQEKKCDTTVCCIKKELAAAEARCKERHNIYSESVKLAADVMDERLSHMNEFRDQLNKERGDYVTHKELDLITAPLKEHCSRYQGSQEVKKDTKTVWLVVAAIAIPIIISLLFKYVG